MVEIPFFVSFKSDTYKESGRSVMMTGEDGESTGTGTAAQSLYGVF
jgi:hypothetical protein